MDVEVVLPGGGRWVSHGLEPDRLTSLMRRERDQIKKNCTGTAQKTVGRPTSADRLQIENKVKWQWFFHADRMKAIFSWRSSRMHKHTHFLIGLGLALKAVLAPAADLQWKLQHRIDLPSKATSIAYSVDGTQLAVGYKDGRLTVWESSTARSRFSSKLHADEINSLQYIADDTQILTIGDDHVARVWSTADWAQLQQLEGIAFSGHLAPDGRTLVAQDPIKLS